MFLLLISMEPHLLLLRLLLGTFQFQVILMRSQEAPEGLYTFTGPSHGKGDSSYAVAFEDRGDATNFCYILQSFFEEMEDFSADIIPLSVKVRILTWSCYLLKTYVCILHNNGNIY